MSRSQLVVGWVIPLLLSAALCVLILISPAPALRPHEGPPTVDDYLEKMRKVHDLARDRHVSAPASDALFENGLQGMLQGLDPYSAYFNASDFKEFWGDTEGEFGGLGIQIEMDAEDHYLTVVTPLEDTPAYALGILPGDKILEIEGLTTKDMRLEDAVRKLRGEPGTAVRILLRHRDADEAVPMLVQRAVIRVRSIKDAHLADPERKIGYIRVTSFQKDTAEEFRQELVKLQAQGLRGLVIDLRFDGGGLLMQAVDLVDLFLDPDPPNDVIVSTRGRREQDSEVYRATKGTTIAKGLPVAVLVNEGTASASEIVAGAMRDHRIGVLVGTRTYGKGSVQSVIKLPDESAVKLTTAKYYTPSGVCINREPGKKDYGLEPDVPVEVDSRFNARLITAWSKASILDPARKAAPAPKGDGVSPAGPAPKEGDASSATPAAPAPEGAPAAAPKDGPAPPAKAPAAEVKEEPFVDVQLVKAIETLRAKLEPK